MTEEHAFQNLRNFFSNEQVIKEWLVSINSTTIQVSIHCFHKLVEYIPDDRYYQDFFSLLLDTISNSSNPDRVITNLNRLLDNTSNPEAFIKHIAANPRQIEILVTLFDCSQFLTEIYLRNPIYYDFLLPDIWSARQKTFKQFQIEINHIINTKSPILERVDELRRYQKKELLRIGVRDLLALFDTVTVTEQLSLLADGIVNACYSLSQEASGETDPQLIVVALGKLGGKELNYSSDIDLLFLSESNGEKLRHQAELLLDYLIRITGEGFLYRVDMRLRPWGRVGPLVSSINAYQKYLITHARTWEKQALLKARAIAGDIKKGKLFLDQLIPFILGIDPDLVRQDIFGMKKQTEDFLAKSGRNWGEVKLGEGSIRDIEFVVQFLQLTKGKENQSIISTNTLETLSRLRTNHFLSTFDQIILRDGYIFLRTVEHFLQIMDYQQTNILPRETQAIHQLARRLGFQGEAASTQFIKTYQNYCKNIREVFLKFLGAINMDASNSELRPMDDFDINRHISRLDPSYQSVFTKEEIRLHAQMASLLTHENLVEVNTILQTDGNWKATIVAYDYPGELSIICGLLLVYGFDILDGQVFTYESEELRDVNPTQKKKKIVDVFTVNNHRQDFDPAAWLEYEQELNQLLLLMDQGNRREARGLLAKRVGLKLTDLNKETTPLYPIEITFDNQVSPKYTALKISSQDTIGFLYELSNALALYRVNIYRVIVESRENRVQDLLFVTNEHNGKIIDEKKIQELKAAIVLIKHFTHLLPLAADPESAMVQFRDFIAKLFQQPNWPVEISIIDQSQVLTGLAQLLGVSNFLWEDFLRMQYSNLFPIVKNIESLKEKRTKEQLIKELRKELNSLSSDRESSLGKTWQEILNAYKDREMFRIDMRNILEFISEFDQFSLELTDLAEVIIGEAAERCFLDLSSQYGNPYLDGSSIRSPCEWIICGLGKFGGSELGYASDIELMLIYQGKGNTDGPRSISNADFFEKLVQNILGAIEARREGIFKIDLQLRPYGKSGRMAVSTEAFKRYFSLSGPAWPYERQALVKLRPVVGSQELARNILLLRDEFVFTGQPFDVISMRAMRERQIRYLVKAGTFNAKYSPGGLIDIEYFVQGMQITHGHKNEKLRTPNTRRAMAELANLNLLSEDNYNRLRKSHTFLRWLINTLRVVRGNANDLTVPSFGSEEFKFLTRRLRYENDYERLRDELNKFTSDVINITSTI
jgi:glutamate-ammonia-ligase adenylyltransferase